ncbi:phosphatidylinositol 4-phosphate 5-kinase type-1 alpha-like [Rhipicephalus sanguineus]|uniref:phosphatidylinositol 4-phosphate 5-kinase type-1 alpha-like n=1 Tax=Rhipicephalus sanguineus TaxID=34632 RepID=UPI0020C1D5F6|nr:phosphatidylinositol 4-phosphate 5-kinase type-1 alpha-like [Rhipicephalus sanguineus]
MRLSRDLRDVVPLGHSHPLGPRGEYSENLNHNPRTLLPKFYGLYCYQCGGKSVRVVVMNNLLPSVVPMHQKFDLKGSTFKRKASKHERSKRFPTFKDLDFLEQHPDGILLETDTYNALMKTIQRDCQVLESFKIMDYSLLIGIHNIDQAAKEQVLYAQNSSGLILKPCTQERQSQGAKDEVKLDPPAGAEEDSISKPAGSVLTQNKVTNRQRLANFSTAMESIQADVEPIDHDEDVPTRISVQRPSFYAERFQEFLAKKVFKKITLSPTLESQQLRRDVSGTSSRMIFSSKMNCWSTGQLQYVSVKAAG